LVGQEYEFIKGHQVTQSYSLIVILELNGVSEVQYKEVMIIDDE